MTIARRAVMLAGLGPLGLAGLADSALAQQGEWPDRPIRILVPSPPGGAYDKAIRPLALEMSAILKQPIVIENRPGASNIVATQAGARSAPDGYTLTMTGMVNTLAAGIYGNLPFDILKDFVHIGAISGGPQWLVVRSDADIASLPDLIQKARREPGSVQYATSGNGSAGHVVMELLQRDAGIQLTHVPYKGGMLALQDVLAGVVPIVVIPPTAVEPHVKAGKLRVLAASSEKRSAKYPDFPTFAELGYRQLTVSAWAGLSAPRGTPDAVVRKLSAALNASLALPQLVYAFELEGMQPISMGPEEYTRWVHSEVNRWGQLTRSLNLKAN